MPNTTDNQTRQSMFCALRTANKIGLTLKSLKTIETNDGYCWSANAVLAGVKIGTVGNGGHGGPLETSIKPDALAAIHSAAKDQYQPLDLYGKPYPEVEVTDEFFAEFFFEDIADDLRELKFWKRKLKTKSCARLKGAKEGEMIVWNAPFDAAMKEVMVKKYGDQIDVIYNEALADLLA